MGVLEGLYLKKCRLLIICFGLLSGISKSQTNYHSIDAIEQKKSTNDQKEFFLELTDPNDTNLYFENRVNESQSENYLSYEQIYNGSGVAVGDINNDGLPDIFLGNNSVFDKLFLNKGNLKFEDITASSGLGLLHYGWTMGINFVDINADGWLDIYVCRAGPYDNPSRLRNKLFINNKDLTFTESATEYGLDNSNHSIQSAFFDYDNDGDLDMYLMNHPPKGFQMSRVKLEDLRKAIDNQEIQTDFFYENTSEGFIDKTKEAGLVNFGYRHGVAVGDINQDGYPDLYISSDFDGADLLYTNTGNKSFINTIDDQLGHLSYSSMGNELVDINNDGLLDIYVVDMVPEDHIRSKVEMPSMNVGNFHSLVRNNFHHQYMGNTLHLNNGHDKFSEISQFAGITKSDWSWGPLFFDIDLDGNKDLFISNGIKHKFIYGDFTKIVKDKVNEMQRRLDYDEINALAINEVIPNSVYQYKGNLQYEKVTDQWMDESLFNSNGVAYADLDNDGDLDLITNNMEDNVSLYKNNASDGMGGNYIKFKLIGPDKNKFAIGTKISIKINGEILFQELHNSRGYLSSVDHAIVFGVGDNKTIKETTIQWPNGKITHLKNLISNQSYTLDYYSQNKVGQTKKPESIKILKNYDVSKLGISTRHHENIHDDFKNQILLPYSQSHNGPFTATADVNNDGLEDLFIGGASGEEGVLYIQNNNGQFTEIIGPWANDKQSEDLGVLFFDSDNDDDMDLYVVSGGSEFPEGSSMYYDRLYINDGLGKFEKHLSALPLLSVSGQVVVANDIDGDGDLDLCVGGRLIPDKYPYSPKSYILINNSGIFTNLTSSIAPEFEYSGMITALNFFDYDNDGDDDLFSVGEWSSINVFQNNHGTFKKVVPKGLENSTGLWFGLESADVDNDGDIDFVAGNIGLNTKYKVSDNKSFHIYCDDFDKNGTYDIVLSDEYKGNLVPTRGRECSTQQMPFIGEKFPTFKLFAEAKLIDIYGEEELDKALHYRAEILESVFVENLGNGSFKIHKLPDQAQFAPIKDFEFIDLNSNGQKELLAVGNMYHTEVETARFDASYGCALEFKSGNFKAISSQSSGFINSGDARSISILKRKNKSPVILVTNNEGHINGFEINRN